MTQIDNQKDNKIIAALFKRLQALEQENQSLKTKLANQQTQKQSTSDKSYLKIKELIIANQAEEQICSLCDCELNTRKVINLVKLYFCNDKCSFVIEKFIDDLIYQLRKK